MEIIDNTGPDRRLYRSREDRVIGGVCGGLAEYFGLNSGGLRIAALIMIVFLGLSLWVYIILWVVIPKSPATISNRKKTRKI